MGNKDDDVFFLFTGVPFTSLSLVGIFILLGVGVDDVLVLLESFRMARITIPNGGTVETRVRFATERAGGEHNHHQRDERNRLFVGVNDGEFIFIFVRAIGLMKSC